MSSNGCSTENRQLQCTFIKITQTGGENSRKMAGKTEWKFACCSAMPLVASLSQRKKNHKHSFHLYLEGINLAGQYSTNFAINMAKNRLNHIQLKPFEVTISASSKAAIRPWVLANCGHRFWPIIGDGGLSLAVWEPQRHGLHVSWLFVAVCWLVQCN